MAADKKIPINVVGGFLGVGKTTALNHLLRHKPSGERWAVLVNEFGEVGIDGALLQEEQVRDGIEVKELAGGCICCTAGVMFEVSLAVLLQHHKPDRLLIEPTGLATLSGIQETLRRPGFAESVDISSFITLTDPAHWADERYVTNDVWRDQIEGADVLLANRVDLATAEQLAIFNSASEELYPPKRHIEHIDHGIFNLQLLDLVRHENLPVETPHPHPHTHHHDHSVVEERDDGTEHRVHEGDHARTSGWIIPPDRLFLHDPLQRWLEEAKHAVGFMRLKGVFRTERGWWSHNVTPGSHEKRRSAHRRDSRVEVIFAPDSPSVDDALLTCLAGEPPSKGENKAGAATGRGSE